MKLLVLAVAALAAVAIAAATEEANGQELSPEAAALIAATRAQPARSPASAAPDFTPRYQGDKPIRIRGVAQTAVDAPLGDEVTGSLGFMCGLKPGAEKYGIAAARGHDETGRFVGAKLSIAFK